MWGRSDRVPNYSSSRTLRPAKASNSTITKTMDIKVVGCRPVQNNSCTLHCNLFFQQVRGNKVTKTRGNTIVENCPENQLSRTNEHGLANLSPAQRHANPAKTLQLIPKRHPHDLKALHEASTKSLGN